MASKKRPDTFSQVKNVLEGAFEFFGKYTAKRQENAKAIAQSLGEKPKTKLKEKKEKLKRSRVLYSQTHELGKTEIDGKMPIYGKSVLFVGTADKNEWKERVFKNKERSEKFIKSAEKFIALNSKIVIDISGMSGNERDDRIKKLKDMVDMVRMLKTSRAEKTEALEGMAGSYGKEFFTGRAGVFNLLAAFERATEYKNFAIRENDYIVLKLGEKSGKRYRVTGLLKKDSTVEEVKKRANQPDQSTMTGFEKVQFELMEKIETDMVKIAADHELLLNHTKRSSTITDANDNPIVKVFVNNAGEYQIGRGTRKFTSKKPKEVTKKASEIVSEIVTENAMAESINEAADWYKGTLKFLTSDAVTSRLPSNVKITSSEGSERVVVGNAQFETNIVLSVDGQQFYGKLDISNKKLVLSTQIVSIKSNKEHIRILRHTVDVNPNNPQALVDEFAKLPQILSGGHPTKNKIELVD